MATMQGPNARPAACHMAWPRARSRNKAASVEAELTALLQVAGGTMLILKKERGVFVMVESRQASHAKKPAPAKVAAPVALCRKQQRPACCCCTCCCGTCCGTCRCGILLRHLLPKGCGTQGRRNLTAIIQHLTYAGANDTGPVAGETFEQKVARLSAVHRAKQMRRRAESQLPRRPPRQCQLPRTGGRGIIASAGCYQLQTPTYSSHTQPTGKVIALMKLYLL